MTLDEKVFRKIGYTIKESRNQIWNLWYDGKYKPMLYVREGRRIISSWEVCAKYLVPFMRERGFKYHIPDPTEEYEDHWFWWRNYITEARCEKIKDDNIALAACEAFMEVEL